MVLFFKKELLPSRAVIAVLIVVTLGLHAAPQAQDVLIMLGQTRSLLAWSLFVAGTLWLGANAWFWANVVQGDHRPHAMLPRLLGLVPFLAVSFAMITAAHAVPGGMGRMMGADSGARNLLRGAGLIAVLGAAIFFVQGSLPRTRAGSIVFLIASLLAAAFGMAFYGFAPVTAGKMLQPAPTILFAASGLMAGGTIITWLGAASRVPTMAVVIVFALALAELRDAGLMPDNHDVRSVHAALPVRTDIATAFRQFLADSAPRFKAPVPVVLVATSSGGLAAAYWTATILGDLSDSVPGFSKQLFAVSAVSGGSLGAMETLAMLSEPHLPAGCASLRTCTQRTLGDDFLAPTLGALLYPDFLQRFLPIPVFADRAAALETAWEAQWRAVTGNDRLAQPFLGLWAGQKPWPALFLNSTSVLRGDRLIASNLQFSSSDMDISLDAGDLLGRTDADLPASAAADTSARFPLFGPVGILRDQNTGKATDLVVDGGYFEDFGATTLLETLDVLAEVARRDNIPVRFIVLQIIGAPAAQLEKPNDALLPRGVWGPLDTLLHSREARGVAATHALARRVAALGGVYAPLRLGFSPTGESAPLSWSLSAVAQHVIDVQWSTTCRKQLAAEMGLDTGGAAMGYAAMMTRLPCPPLR